MSFTYNPGGTDTVSQIRFAIADTQNSASSPNLFEDEELLGAYALPEAAGNVSLAGAIAFETLAGDKARISLLSKQGPNTQDTRVLSETYREMAKALRLRAVVAPVVISTRQVFHIHGPDWEHCEAGPWPRDWE